jgi:beta-mannanase
LVGRRVSIASYYQDFASGPNFDAASATRLWNGGSTPMLAWEPENGRGPVTNQPSYSLATIIAGAHDQLITRWAREIARWGKPILLRFGPEMNGNWNPWSEGVNGNLPGQYVRAWRHVHTLFVRAGARNVIWVWNPMIDFTGSTPLANLYPGDAYVDVVGLDGYNWGTSQSWSAWQTPTQVFAATVAAVKRLTARPMLLCEVASSEKGGNKAAWVTRFFAYLAATPAIHGLVWFEFNKETDWRVESSPSSARAFISALSRSNYR